MRSLIGPASGDDYVVCRRWLCLKASVRDSFYRCLHRVESWRSCLSTWNMLHLAGFGFVSKLLFGTASTDAYIEWSLGGLVSLHGTCYILLALALSRSFCSRQFLQMFTSCPNHTNEYIYIAHGTCHISPAFSQCFCSEQLLQMSI